MLQDWDAGSVGNNGGITVRLPGLEASTRVKIFPHWKGGTRSTATGPLPAAA